MAPFRPTNINKRAYPGNGNVIGPTTQTRLGISTTTCCSSTTVCSSCVNITLSLGCCVGGGCACPCCSVCCSCPATSCEKIVPSGIWSSFEQYEAASRGAWGSGVTTSFGTATCLCCFNRGYTCCGGGFIDYKSYFFCCGPSTAKWFVAPACTEIRTCWSCLACAVSTTNSCLGSCGWFVPTCTDLRNGWSCGSYWDNIGQTGFFSYWSSTQINQTTAIYVNFANGAFYNAGVSGQAQVRTFRCTPT